MMLSQGAAAGQSAGIQMKCLYCGLPDCNLEKIYKRTGTGPKYICFYCEFTERFTVVDLAKKIGVSSTYLKSQIENMEFFKTFYIERGIDVNNAPLGYLELEICGLCSMPITRNTSAEDHNSTAMHSSGLIKKCNKGCGRYIWIMSLHEQYCKKSCEYEGCKKKYDRTDVHFEKDHKPFFCPIVGCDKGFPPDNIEQICTHIVKTHLLHTVQSFLRRKSLKLWKTSLTM
ncbi:Hypothetical predicted protein [Cloeon dipterum]|uniref:Uncharacterized protein n=1 Tax=Cloeon dipterum TaxID=197152 RepID=A0A8S1CXN7_9INSE|nr:Hypothetical predicted protein [Cloeon dipterum]